MWLSNTTVPSVDLVLGVCLDLGLHGLLGLLRLLVELLGLVVLSHLRHLAAVLQLTEGALDALVRAVEVEHLHEGIGDVRLVHGPRHGDLGGHRGQRDDAQRSANAQDRGKDSHDDARGGARVEREAENGQGQTRVESGQADFAETLGDEILIDLIHNQGLISLMVNLRLRLDESRDLDMGGD